MLLDHPSLIAGGWVGTMSLQWRIAAALAAVAALATMSVGMISYRATSGRLMEEVDRSIRTAMATIIDSPSRSLTSRGVVDTYVIQIVGPSGQVRGSNQVPPIPVERGAEEVVGRLGRQDLETVKTDDDKVRMFTYGVGGGAFQVGRSIEENERVLDDLKWRTALVVLLVTVAAALLGWLIARTVAGPLKRLTRAATDVERSGRLDVEVPVSGKDEVGQLGTAFNGMLGALANSREAQQRLVEDAGHELRTPLTSVRTNLAVLRRHPDLDPEMRQRVLEDLETETEELVALVEEIVSLARGTIDESPATSFELGEVARTVAARAHRRHARQVNVTADHSVVEASPAAVERAISNLVDNAAKFDRSGGPIDVVVADRSVVVHDRGPGIAAEDRERVFDRFYRAEGARSLPGSGLGLSIVREVAERNGGTVLVAERPGGGVSVGFTMYGAGPPVAPNGPDVPGS